MQTQIEGADLSNYGNSTAQAYIFSRGQNQESGRARAEVRDNLLVLSFAKGHRFTSEYISIHGATRVFRRRLASRRFIWTLAWSLILLIFGVIMSVVLPESIRLGVAGVFAFISMSLLLLSPVALLVPIRIVQITFNKPHRADHLSLQYRRGKDPALDAIIDEIPDANPKDHSHEPRAHAVVRTNWLNAFPLRFTAIMTGVVYFGLYSLASIFERTTEAAGGAIHLASWTLWLLPLPFLCIVGYTLWCAARGKGIWAQRADRRDAIKALARGDFEGLEQSLLNILRAVPEDLESRQLLAHACIVSGRYGDARRCLDQIPETVIRVREEMERQLLVIEGMELESGDSLPSIGA